MGDGGVEVIQDEELGFRVSRDSEDARAGPGAQNAKSFLRWKAVLLLVHSAFSWGDSFIWMPSS